MVLLFEHIYKNTSSLRRLKYVKQDFFCVFNIVSCEIDNRIFVNLQDEDVSYICCSRRVCWTHVSIRGRIHVMEDIAVRLYRRATPGKVRWSKRLLNPCVKRKQSGIDGNHRVSAIVFEWHRYGVGDRPTVC